MKVVITGGAGFLGLRLATRLLELGKLKGPDGQLHHIDELVLFDLHEPTEVPAQKGIKVNCVCGQVSNRETVQALIDRDDISVFHLASVVSGEGEKNFDLAMRVNLDGARYLLEAMRERQGCPRLVFTSSIVVFGGQAMPEVVGDMAKQTPQTTYGITKTIGELLINDYSRKGFLDGRSARLPTVIIRPGKANAAASSFASGVFREPLNNVECLLPVPRDTMMPVLGYRAIVEGLIHLHNLDAEKLGDDRAVSLPCLNVSVAQMIDALKRVAGSRRLGVITDQPDSFITRVVQSWASECETSRAQQLDFPTEQSLDEIVEYYIADYLQPRH